MPIIPTQVPRQTLPYGDRPFVEIDSGHLVTEAYQYLQRLHQGVASTVSNVGTIIETTNTMLVDMAGTDLKLALLQREIDNLQIQIGLIDTSGGAPPPPSLPAGGINLATAFGLSFFFR